MIEEIINIFRIPQAVKKLEDETIRNRLMLFFELAIAVVFGALVALLMFRTVTMQENSMEPTIAVGDTFFIDQFSYNMGEPKRGDIIVFRTSGSDDAALHLSRVIGLPGETILIKDGRIYIDGELYTEVNGFETIKNPGLAAEGVDLSSGEYFVLGDNRNNSDDSRYSDVGKVSKKYLIGKIWFQIYPRHEIGVVR